MLSEKRHGMSGLKTEDNKPGCGALSARRQYTGHVVLMPADDLQELDRFTAEIVACLEPETAVERQLALLYAGFQWGIHRAAAIENTLFTLGTLEVGSKTPNLGEPKSQNVISNAVTFRRHSRTFVSVARYSQCLVAQSAQVLAQLKQFQSDRKKPQSGEDQVGRAAA